MENRHLTMATIGVFSLCLAWSLVPGKAIAQESDRPQQVASLKADIQDLNWIAGHWKGQAMGGDFEETWNAPMGGAMMGMFKFVENDEVKFYEILTIVPAGQSLVLRLKHFDAGLKGWEAKDESVEFPLLELTDKLARFNGLRFERLADDRMNIRVMAKEGDQEAKELLFECKRVKTN